MLISEVIKELEELKTELGDIEVKVLDLESDAGDELCLCVIEENEVPQILIISSSLAEAVMEDDDERID
jgi:hypothetical protein